MNKTNDVVHDVLSILEEIEEVLKSPALGTVDGLKNASIFAISRLKEISLLS